MFLDSSIPADYKYIVELNNNFVVLANTRLLLKDTNYSVYIQFFNPSTEVIKINDYKLTLDNATQIDTQYFYDYDPTTGSILDSSTLVYSKSCFTLDETYISHDLFDRHDYWSIALTVGLFLALFIIIVNLATSLVHRGGIFHA